MFVSIYKTPFTRLQFLSKQAYEKNMFKQVVLVPQMLGQLVKHCSDERKDRKLEFFFYTNTVEKAQKLICNLQSMNYEITQSNNIGYGKKLISISGWTTEMKMDHNVIRQWARQMCEIGFKYDCEFDGWGALIEKV